MNLWFRIRRAIGFAIHTVVGWVTAPLRGLQDIGHLSGRDEWRGERGEQEDGPRPGLFRRLGWLVIGLFDGAWRLVVVSLLWLTDPANRLRVAIGIPILAGIGVGIFFAWRTWMVRVEDQIAEHEIAAKTAIAAEDWDTARIHYELLVELNKEEPRYRFNLAMIHSQDAERFQETFDEMVELAPHNGEGYGPAHQWLIQILGNLPAENLAQLGINASDRRRLVRHHVEAALVSDPDNLSILKIKADFDISTDPAAALAIYKRVAELEPRYSFQVADLQRRLGQDDSARATIEAFNVAIRQKIDQQEYQPQDVADLLVTSLMLQQYQKAYEALEQYEDQLEPESARKLRAQILLALATMDFESDDAETRRQGLERLRESIRLAPNDREAFKLLGLYAGMATENQDVVISTCRELISDGVPTASLHLLLSGMLLARQEFDEAEQVLKAGLLVDRNSGEILNNLAWLYANRPEQDLERAKELSDRSIALVRSNPSFYETRGSILVKQGKLNEAIADFERAMQGMPNSEKLLQQCAEVYEELGDQSLAKAYRDRLARVRESKEQQQTVQPDG